LGADVVELQVVEADAFALALRQREPDELLRCVHSVAGVGVPECLLNCGSSRHVFQQYSQGKIALSLLRLQRVDADLDALQQVGMGIVREL
jgi:hypothetical protein